MTTCRDTYLKIFFAIVFVLILPQTSSARMKVRDCNYSLAQSNAGKFRAKADKNFTGLKDDLDKRDQAINKGLVKTARDLVIISDFAKWGDYNADQTNEWLKSKIDLFFTLNPTTDDVYDFAELTGGDVEMDRILRERGLSRVKSAGDFVKLAKYRRSGRSFNSFTIEDVYQVHKWIEENYQSHFLGKKPTIDDFIKLKNIVAGYELSRKIANNALGLVNNPDQFIELAGWNNFEDYARDPEQVLIWQRKDREIQALWISSNYHRFLRLNPSKNHQQRLRMLPGGENLPSL